MSILSTLRPFQHEAVDATLRMPKYLNPLIISPTGSGKTHIIASIAELRVDDQILIITPRKKLVQQTLAKISTAGVMSGRYGNDDGSDHRVIIATYQTLLNRDFKTPTLIILDEAHLLPDDDSEYRSLIESFPFAQVIGLTATPLRGNYHLLDDRFWTKSFEIGIIPLIQQGYLVPPREISCGSQFDTEECSNDEVTAEILPDLIKSWRKHNVTHPLVFCKNIEHAITTTELIKDLGYSANLVHSLMSEKDIDDNFETFENSDMCALVNIGICTTGLDIPKINAIVFLRNVTSASLFLQIVGRGLRIHLASNKRECLVYDFGSASVRYGSITDPEFGTTSASKSSATSRYKQCPVCDTANANVALYCHHCDYKFEFKTMISAMSSEINLLGSDVNFSHVTSITEKIEYNIVQLDSQHTLYDTQKTLNVGDFIVSKNITNKVVELVCKLANH